jgi:hypothetical protein
MTPKLLLLAAALAVPFAAPAPIHAGEPVVWTEIADPDPHFVPPSEPRPTRKAKEPRKARLQSSEEQSAYEAGRSLGDAAMALEAAACKAIKDAGTPLAEAPAWAGSCPP